MLLELGIQNYALMEDVNITLGEGLHILTGETGAGKSIIIGALEMLLGARAHKDLIRTGAERALIQALFSISGNTGVERKLQDLGLESQEEQVIIHREISRQGVNRIRCNGQLITLQQLRQITSLLLDIHGQHEYQSLLSQENQRNILDAFGGQDLLLVRKEIESLYRAWKEKERELQSLSEKETNRKERIDILEFQLQELNEAELSQHEEMHLMDEHKILTNGERLHTGTKALFHQLSGETMEEGLLDRLGHMMRELSSLLEVDKALETPHELMNAAYYQLQEAAHELRLYSEGITVDERRLEEINKRLEIINDLKRKYGPTLEKVMEYHRAIQKEYEELQGFSRSLQALEIEVKQVEKDYRDRAERLSLFRREAAGQFSCRLLAQLKDLAMAQTRFEIEISPIEQKAYPHGMDQIEFQIAPNPGEALKPLSRIASGGEMSRIMLALKTMMGSIEQVPTMVFDEIDSGIGGRTAQKVADKLAVISKSHQVLAITHLPQIASTAHHHFRIEKTMEGQRTKTMIRPLPPEERIKELARMLEGDSSTTALSHARAMLHSAQERRAETLGK